QEKTDASPPTAVQPKPSALRPGCSIPAKRASGRDAPTPVQPSADALLQEIYLVVADRLSAALPSRPDLPPARASPMQAGPPPVACQKIPPATWWRIPDHRASCIAGFQSFRRTLP